MLDMVDMTHQKRYSRLIKAFMLLGILWTAFIISLLFWFIKSANDHSTETTLSHARAFFNQIMQARYWNAGHGGVYVPITEESQPNPHLKLPHRDVTTTDSQKLTMINPAYMTRQMAEISRAENQVIFHITSLNPLRPENKAEDWESRAMQSFTDAESEFYEWIDPAEKQDAAFRYIAPLYTEKPCLTCHREQGYALGDLRGAISVTIPAEKIIAKKKQGNIMLSFSHFTIWLMGLLGLFFTFRLTRSEFMEHSVLIEHAFKEVKILRGFIYICAACKKVRNDEGSWDQIEEYVRDRSEAEFSHSICPDCKQKMYPDY